MKCWQSEATSMEKSFPDVPDDEYLSRREQIKEKKNERPRRTHQRRMHQVQSGEGEGVARDAGVGGGGGF